MRVHMQKRRTEVAESVRAFAANGGLQISHQQRRGYTFPGNITQEKTEQAVTEIQKIVIVTPDPPGCGRRACIPDSCELLRVPRQHLPLNRFRQLQVQSEPRVVADDSVTVREIQVDILNHR